MVVMGEHYFFYRPSSWPLLHHPCRVVGGLAEASRRVIGSVQIFGVEVVEKEGEKEVETLLVVLDADG